MYEAASVQELNSSYQLDNRKKCGCNKKDIYFLKGERTETQDEK